VKYDTIMILTGCKIHPVMTSFETVFHYGNCVFNCTGALL